MPPSAGETIRLETPLAVVGVGVGVGVCVTEGVGVSSARAIDDVATAPHDSVSAITEAAVRRHPRVRGVDRIEVIGMWSVNTRHTT